MFNFITFHGKMTPEIHLDCGSNVAVVAQMGYTTKFMTRSDDFLSIVMRSDLQGDSIQLGLESIFKFLECLCVALTLLLH